MVELNKLNKFLNDLYKFGDYEDYCFNGIQIEGKKEIKKIIFGVSFNYEFLKRAIDSNADALIVHHGIFGKKFFRLYGILKEKIKILLDKNITLIGIHLPMDAHPEIGHNALLFKYIGAKIVEPIGVGFIGINEKKIKLNNIIEKYHLKLHTHNLKYYESFNKISEKIFNIEIKYGFQIIKNGIDVPEKIAIISGASASYYEKCIELGVDTFICGEIKEQIPAISKETKTNFINIGHNNSEKPGILKLIEIIKNKFDVETKFIHIDNYI